MRLSCRALPHRSEKTLNSARTDAPGVGGSAHLDARPSVNQAKAAVLHMTLRSEYADQREYQEFGLQSPWWSQSSWPGDAPTRQILRRLSAQAQPGRARR